MPSPAPHEIASAVAAVVSALGGTFAVVAAFRSASSANEAARSVEQAERRSLLRDVSNTASKVQLAIVAATSRASELQTEYQTAEAFSGSFENSAVAPDAALFSGGARSLEAAPLEEIDRVLIRLSESLLMVQTVREEFDRKYLAVSSQNLLHRQVVLNGKNGR
jgi:hypothetical protein